MAKLHLITRQIIGMINTFNLKWEVLTSRFWGILKVNHCDYDDANLSDDGMNANTFIDLLDLFAFSREVF